MAKLSSSPADNFVVCVCCDITTNSKLTKATDCITQTASHNTMPKFHYLVHFPHQIIQYGPMRNHWCMRYEAKNVF